MMTRMKSFGLPLAVALVFATGGCNHKASPLTEEERRQIESEMGLKLPADVAVLTSGYRGGRGPYYWVFYSAAGITLRPETPEPEYGSSNGAVDIPIEDMRKAFQARVKGTLPPARAASRVAWTHGAYSFRSNLLKTEGGDYLEVQRFARQDTSGELPAVTRAEHIDALILDLTLCAAIPLIVVLAVCALVAKATCGSMKAMCACKPKPLYLLMTAPCAFLVIGFVAWCVLWMVKPGYRIVCCVGPSMAIVAGCYLASVLASRTKRRASGVFIAAFVPWVAAFLYLGAFVVGHVVRVLYCPLPR